MSGGGCVRQSQLAYAEFLKSPAWREIRKKRLAIDSYRCQSCGSSGLLDMHHVKYVRWGTEEMGDLLSLCRTCHYEIHQEQDVNVISGTVEESREIGAELVTSAAMRARYMDRTEVLAKVKSFQTVTALNGGQYATTKMLAADYEISIKTIERVVERNFRELTDNGRIVANRADLERLGLTDILSVSRAKEMALHPPRVILLIGMMLRKSLVARNVRQLLLDHAFTSPSVAVRPETSIAETQVPLDKDLQILQGLIGHLQQTRNDVRELDERVTRIEQQAIPADRAPSLDGIGLAAQLGFRQGEGGRNEMYRRFREQVGSMRYKNGISGEMEFTEGYEHWGEVIRINKKGAPPRMVPFFYAETVELAREVLAMPLSVAALNPADPGRP